MVVYGCRHININFDLPSSPPARILNVIIFSLLILGSRLIIFSPLSSSHVIGWITGRIGKLVTRSKSKIGNTFTQSRIKNNIVENVCFLNPLLNVWKLITFFRVLGTDHNSIFVLLKKRFILHDKLYQLTPLFHVTINLIRYLLGLGDC